MQILPPLTPQAATVQDAAVVKFTGLVCPQCKRPVAQIEYETPSAMAFYCHGCDNRWSAAAQGAKPH